jgi:hypothetical protein
VKNFIGQEISVGDPVIFAQEKERLIIGLVIEINEEENYVILSLTPMEGRQYDATIYAPQRSIVKVY